MLADPPETREDGEGLLHRRAAIDRKAPCGTGNLDLQESTERLEHGLHDDVVVASPCVARDAGTGRAVVVVRAAVTLAGLARAVMRDEADERRARGRPPGARILPLRPGRGQVVHLSREAGIEPLVE